MISSNGKTKMQSLKLRPSFPTLKKKKKRIKFNLYKKTCIHEIAGKMGSNPRHSMLKMMR